MSIILDSPAAQHDFSRGSHWYHESPFLPIGEGGENEPGAPSLKDTATRRLVMDQSALKPELFENVPWKIAKELWEFLGNRWVNSVNFEWINGSMLTTSVGASKRF